MHGQRLPQPERAEGQGDGDCSQGAAGGGAVVHRLPPPDQEKYAYEDERDDQDVIRQDVEQVLEERRGVLICRGGTQFKGEGAVCAVYFENATCVRGFDIFAVRAENVDLLLP